MYDVRFGINLMGDVIMEAQIKVEDVLAQINKIKNGNKKLTKKQKEELEQLDKQLEETKQKEVEYAELWLSKVRNIKPFVSVKTQSVKDFYREISKGKITVNHSYQRQKVWDTRRQQGLIKTFIEGLPIPELIAAQKTSKDGVYYEIVDGQQRMETIKDLYENKIRLPLMIPHILGGGGTYKYASREIKELIDTAQLTVKIIDTDSLVTIKKTYLRLQQGMNTRLGEELLGEDGNAYDALLEIHNHKLFARILENDTRELYMAISAYFFSATDNVSNSFSKDPVVAMIERKAETDVTPLSKECLTIMSLLDNVLEKSNHKQLPYYDIIALYIVFLKLSRDDYLIDSYVMDSYDNLWDKIRAVKLAQADCKEIPADLIKYVTVANRSRSITSGSLKWYTDLLIEEIRDSPYAIKRGD